MEKARKNIWTLVVAGLLGIVLIVYLFSAQVPAGQVGVLFTFGKYSRTFEEPGLHFRLPSPIQEVRLIDTRTRLFESKYQECMTKDQKNLSILITTGWCIRDPELFIRKLQNAENAESRIKSRIDSARNRALAEFELHDLVNTDFDQQQKSFNQFEQRMRDLVRADLKPTAAPATGEGEAEDLGVEVTYIAVQQMTFPEETSQKVFERMKKEREKESKAYISQGESEAKKIISDAEAEKQETVAKAMAEAEITRGKADAEAAKYYAVFQKNPELARYLRSVKTLRKVLSKESTVLLSTDNAPFDLLEKDAVPTAIAPELND